MFCKYKRTIGKKKVTKKTGSLKVPIALCGSVNQNIDCIDSPYIFVLDLFLRGSYRSNIWAMNMYIVAIEKKYIKYFVYFTNKSNFLPCKK